MEAKVTMVTAVLDFAKRHQLSVFVQRRLSKGHNLFKFLWWCSETLNSSFLSDVSAVGTRRNERVLFFLLMTRWCYLLPNTETLWRHTHKLMTYTQVGRHFYSSNTRSMCFEHLQHRYQSFEIIFLRGRYDKSVHTKKKYQKLSHFSYSWKSLTCMAFQM